MCNNFYIIQIFQKSFDVYIDKNPNDTIPIKYTTVKDVKDTIKNWRDYIKIKIYT